MDEIQFERLMNKIKNSSNKEKNNYDTILVNIDEIPNWHKKINKMAFPLIEISNKLKPTLIQISKMSKFINSIQTKNIKLALKLGELTENLKNNSSIIFDDEIDLIDKTLDENKKEINGLKNKLLEKEENWNKEKQELLKQIEILQNQQTSNSNRTELIKLMNMIKRYPLDTVEGLATRLHKAESTLKKQFKEICEKEFNIPEYETNKGIKRVRELLFSNNTKSY